MSYFAPSWLLTQALGRSLRLGALTDAFQSHVPTFANFGSGRLRHGTPRPDIAWQHRTPPPRQFETAFLFPLSKAHFPRAQIRPKFGGRRLPSENQTRIEPGAPGKASTSLPPEALKSNKSLVLATQTTRIHSELAKICPSDDSRYRRDHRHPFQKQTIIYQCE